MSGFQPSAHPAPPVFGDADYLDDDTYGLDCRRNMELRNTTIAGVVLVGVTRQDGAAMGPDDLAVSAVGVVDAGVTIQLPGGPVVATAGTFVSWKATGGNSGVGYLVKLAFTLLSGDVINRTIIINIPQYVG